MATFAGESRFMVAGKRIMLYTNYVTRKLQKVYNEELVPLKVCYNSYYNSF